MSTKMHYFYPKIATIAQCSDGLLRLGALSPDSQPSAAGDFISRPSPTLPP